MNCGIFCLTWEKEAIMFLRLAVLFISWKLALKQKKFDHPCYRCWKFSALMLLNYFNNCCCQYSRLFTNCVMKLTPGHCRCSGHRYGSSRWWTWSIHRPWEGWTWRGKKLFRWSSSWRQKNPRNSFSSWITLSPMKFLFFFSFIFFSNPF